MLMALYVSHHHICNTYDLTRMYVCFVRKKGNTAHYFYITITHSNSRRLTKNKLICLVMVLLTSELLFLFMMNYFECCSFICFDICL